MSIPRLTVVLGLALVSMLAVVVLRAESTRLNYELSRLDHDVELLQRDIEDRRLELIRMRSPSQVWAQARRLNAIPTLENETPNGSATADDATDANSAKPHRETSRAPAATSAKPRGKTPAKPPAKPAPRPTGGARSGTNTKPKKPS